MRRDRQTVMLGWGAAAGWPVSGSPRIEVNETFAPAVAANGADAAGAGGGVASGVEAALGADQAPADQQHQGGDARGPVADQDADAPGEPGEVIHGAHVLEPLRVLHRPFVLPS